MLASETPTQSVNPPPCDVRDFNNRLQIIKQSKPTFANPPVNHEAIKRLTSDGFFHLTKTLRKISTPSFIFNSSTLAASQLLAIGFYNLSLEREELLPLSMGEKGMLFPCHPLRLRQVLSADVQPSLEKGGRDAVSQACQTRLPAPPASLTGLRVTLHVPRVTDKLQARTLHRAPCSCGATSRHMS